MQSLDPFFNQNAKRQNCEKWFVRKNQGILLSHSCNCAAHEATNGNMISITFFSPSTPFSEKAYTRPSQLGNTVTDKIRRRRGRIFSGFESAGVSYVNGQRVNSDEKQLDKTTASNSASNSNPYANANAPPAEPAGGYRHQVNSATNLGYPPYPSSDTGSKNGYPSYPGGNTGSNNGYPPYPSPNQGNRQQDLGYPPYPTHNKMPMPGQSNYPSYPGQPGHSNYPVYPGQQPGGYQGYPQQLPPGHQNYPYPNYPNQNRMYHNNVYSGYRRNSAIVQSPCNLVIVYLASLLVVVAFANNRSWSPKWMDDTVMDDGGSENLSRFDVR